MEEKKVEKKYGHTSKEISNILDKMIVSILEEVIDTDLKHALTMDRLKGLRKIGDAPLAFQDRFFLLMDVLAPSKHYAYQFLRAKHPQMLGIFVWLCKLYSEECSYDIETYSSTCDNNDVE